MAMNFDESDGGGDASPVSSQYSSCGESDLERYCSANSVMGTPSLCSSVGASQEFESFSLGLGERFNTKFQDKKLLGSGELNYCDETSDVDLGISVELGQSSVGLMNGLNRFDNGEASSSREELYNVDGGNLLSSKAGSELLMGLDEEIFGEDDLVGVVPWRENVELGFVSSSQNERCKDGVSAEASGGNMLNLGVGADAKEGSQYCMGIEQVDSYLAGLDLHCDWGFDSKEGGRGSNESETSSRYDHSDGEDSMFGCGTDDEKKIDLSHRKIIQYPQGENGRNENSLLMTSSVAFGSDDWDDFIQETGERPITSMVPAELQGQKQGGMEFERDNDVIDISIARHKNKSIHDILEFSKTCYRNPIGEAEQLEKTKDMTVTNNQAGVIESTDYLQPCSVSNIFGKEHEPLTKEEPLKEKMTIKDGGFEREHQYTRAEEVTGMDDSHISESIEQDKIKLQLDPLSDVTVHQLWPASQEDTEDRKVEFFEESKSDSMMPLAENDIKKIMKDSPVAFNLSEDHPSHVKTENLESNEFYNEFVHEMEEILLDSGNSSGARFTLGSRTYSSQISLPLRDGGPTASTSGIDDAYPLIQHHVIVDGVEVVGARQKRGDVSLSERLVGMKEYTVYRIRVWSGENHWEVERRYRDFFTLHRRIKTLFIDQGWILPSPWSSVERESRKIFGNASPDVIAERSVLIQECLQSILHSRFSSNPPNALIWFLSPPKDVPSSPTSSTYVPQSPYSTRDTDTDDVPTLGKTISLVVEVRPYKSSKQMLDGQHYTCAGCHKHFDDGKTLMRELVQTLGWGKPRLCEYSGQLFCSLCHSNETAVLPARVLHFWDFTLYPVSQLAKSYLDSIHDKPMLCVSAVNPFIFSKVPALQHVMNVRKKIGAMFVYVRCPFRRSIYKGLGSRRYLLESIDFFALRDLIDLSKGVFSALPVMVETLSRKILEHIVEQCLICCDVGVPCNARQACEDPTSLIFPFQEGEIERCKSCESVFHKPCFKKISGCPCGAFLNHGEVNGGKVKRSLGVGPDVGSTLDLLGRKWDSRPVGFLSGLFSKAKQGKSRENDTVILMGSLPGTSS